MRNLGLLQRNMQVSDEGRRKATGNLNALGCSVFLLFYHTLRGIMRKALKQGKSERRKMSTATGDPFVFPFLPLNHERFVTLILH